MIIKNVAVGLGTFAGVMTVVVLAIIGCGYAHVYFEQKKIRKMQDEIELIQDEINLIRFNIEDRLKYLHGATIIPNQER